jgi:hypothetical protein
MYRSMLGQREVHGDLYSHGNGHTVLRTILHTWAKAPLADSFDGLLVQTVTQALHYGHVPRLAAGIDGERYQDDP